jgi:hypothetical protein
MKHSLSLLAGVAGACILLRGGAVQAQSAITNVTPNGAYQFEPSGTLSFTATSPAGIDPTNISVQLTVTSLQTGQSFIRSLSSVNGLTIGGTPTSRSVSAILNSNTLYSAAIQVTDAASSSANATVTFDTINPAYTFEAEDYDYTSNSITGLFIDNPQTNLYAGLGATLGIDCQHTVNGPTEGHAYRTNSPGLVTEPAGDKARIQYSTGQQDYDVGFNNGGDFGNYTRHFPAGTYNVYLRGSGGNGPQADAASMTVSGSASLNGTGGGSAPFQFSILGRGWQAYDWSPLKDSAGNLAQLVIPNDGTANSIKVTIDRGNCNENFYMLLPIDTNVVVSTASITNIYPDGTHLFQNTNLLSFTASAPDGISQSDISVVITGTNLYGHGSVSSLNSGNGLTITGTSTSWNVSAALTSNTIYTVFIQVNDAHGVPASATVSFDTINPVYTFEAEDFDFGGGNFFDNPQTNAYNGYDGIAEVDFHATQHGGAYNRIGLTTEGASDKTRGAYDGTGYTDYDVGFNDGGNWGNYTRNYPAGVYSIYVRASDGNGNGSSDSGSISIVTSGVGSTTQDLVQLGKFGVQPTGGWQTYAWVPVLDPHGNLAQFTGGSKQTLRMTIDGGNCNENFFLLTPADPNLVLKPYIDGFQPDGKSIFQFTNQLSFVVHSQPGTATSNIVLNLNGVNVSGLSYGGTPTIRTVSYEMQSNTLYTAIITVTDANGSASQTNVFDTFNSSNYQWEAEDYDYNGGSFQDNPQVNFYKGLGSIADVDNHQSDLSAQPFLYRTNSAQDPAPSTTTSGDQARSQLAGGTDYNIGFFGGGSWCNYTRHYPAGTYNVVGRFAEGAATTTATLSQVTAGAGTTNQTKNQIGTFTIAPQGWSTWEWAPLRDGNGNLAKVALDGSAATLQLGGSPVIGQPEVNVNFLMLVPTTPSPKLVAAIGGGNITVSFPTQTGFNYQVQYKNRLTDANWTSLGGSIAGDGSVKSATDSTTAASRFYRVQIQ